MKKLLLATREEVKRQKFLLEVKGLIENKALFQLEEVLKTTRKRKAIKVFHNIYIIG